MADNDKDASATEEIKVPEFDRADSLFDFDMGVKVEEGVSGFTGIINARVIWDSGSIQYSVKPRMTDNDKDAAGKWMDGDYFKVLEGGVGNRYGEPNFLFTNGDEVQSNKTPFEGTVIGMAQHLNGCITYFVLAKKLQKGRTVQEWFPEQELKMLQKQAVVTEKRSTGGPESCSEGVHRG